MASKQLGKLRQWAGEVISTRDKTDVSDEFKDLEHDVELRRQGLWKLHITSEAYADALSKKKDCEVLPNDKLLPLDALGVIMIQHGEEFGDESAFGTSLVSLGRAHCQIATLQETFAISFEDTYLKSIRRSEADIKEYQNERKKLDSRRLTYDAALAKYEKLKDNKNSKKDKERREAEEEYETAKLRFEETQVDVEYRMHSIQENEVTQLRDLSNLLHLEISFMQQQLDILKDTKAGWIEEQLLTQMEATHKRARRSPPPPPSVLPSRDAEDIAPASTPNGNSNAPSRFNSIRSAKSKSSQPPGTPKSHHSRKSSKGASSLRLSSSESDSDSGSESESDDDEESDGGKGKKKNGGFRNRARSLTSSRKSDAGSQKNAGSRPPSRSSRKRADSAATLGKDKDGKEKDGKEKDKEKDKKKSSVSGWVSVLPGMGKSKKEREKEKERSKFEALMDDRDDMPSDGMGGDTEEDDGDLSADEEFGRRRPGSALSGSSKKSGDKDKGKKDKDEIEKKGKTTPAMTPSASPRISTRLIRTASNPPSPHGSPSLPNSSLSSSPKKNKQKRKVVVALYDFTASTSDELSFKSGDKIIVTNEVVDGWWMGEILTSSASNLDVSGVGRKGMFPTNYTKVLPERPSPPLSSFNSNNNNSHSNSNSSLSSVSSSSGLKPALSRIRTDENSVTGVGTNGSARSSLDGIIQFPNRIRGNTLTVKGPSTYPYPSPSASSSDRSFASTDDRPFKDGNTEDAHHPFSDQQQGYISSGRSPVNGHFYAESIGGSEVEELDDDRTHRYSDSSDFPVTFNSPLGSTEKEKDVVAQLTRRFSGPPPPITRRVTEATTTSGAAKRPPPPPPPPRRSTNNALSTPTLSSSLSTPTSTSTPLPYIPRRPPTAPGSSQSSTTSSFLNVAQAGVGKGKVAGLDGLDAQGLTHSPFDDLVGGVGNGCGNFKQNPFKQMGFCSNCFKMHP